VNTPLDSSHLELLAPGRLSSWLAALMPDAACQVWTEGDLDMDIYLSFPSSLERSAVQNRKSYRIHPRFTIKCTHGTLFVFSHVDDLHFCHEARCSNTVVAGESSHRFAFVFRWLELRRLFHADPCCKHGQYLTEALRQCETDKKAQKAKRRRGGHT